MTNVLVCIVASFVGCWIGTLIGRAILNHLDEKDKSE